MRVSAEWATPGRTRWSTRGDRSQSERAFGGGHRSYRSDDRASRAVCDRGRAAVNSHEVGGVHRGDRNSWELVDDHEVSDLAGSRGGGRDGDILICELSVILKDDGLGELVMTYPQMRWRGWRQQSQPRRRRPS